MWLFFLLPIPTKIPWCLSDLVHVQLDESPDHSMLWHIEGQRETRGEGSVGDKKIHDTKHVTLRFWLQCRCPHRPWDQCRAMRDNPTKTPAIVRPHGSWQYQPSNEQIKKQKNMRRPGIEPGPNPWQGSIVPFNYRRYDCKSDLRVLWGGAVPARIELATYWLTVKRAATALRNLVIFWLHS